MNDASASRLPSADILGVRVHAVDGPAVLKYIDACAAEAVPGYLCACNVDSIMLARRMPDHRQALADADIAFPDGAPVAWGLRRLGFGRQTRVDGPGLMVDCCELAMTRGYPVFLYGSTTEVLDRLAHNLRRDFPRLEIAGTCSPPFRTLTREEDESIVATVKESGARIVFVGLGAPKQELWMHRHQDRLPAVMIGVGAAFDFHAEVLRRAPAWMQQSGLEWLYRLQQEPRRLWRRYLLGNTAFAVLLAAQLLASGYTRRGTA